MKLVEREKPLKLLWLEAIQRRLLEEDPEASHFAEQLRRINAGFAGEKRVDREWQEILSPHTFSVLHNLTLTNAANHMHQIDTLFICSHFLLIVEIKNISGRLDFDGITHQCTRTKLDGTVEGFPNAITQIQRHIQFLNSIFRNYSLPIEGVVILSNPSTIIASHPNTIPVIHVAGLQTHLQKLFKKYSQPVLTDEHLNHCVQHFCDRHRPREEVISIASSRIRHGVLCPTCQYKHRMQHHRGIWKCPICHYASEEIFAEALQDYRLLIGHTITNSQLRAFSGLTSRYAATRLLQKFQFPSTGTYKNRIYELPKNLVEYMKPFF